jgi:hypothetical protein
MADHGLSHCHTSLLLCSAFVFTHTCIWWHSCHDAWSHTLPGGLSCTTLLLSFAIHQREDLTAALVTSAAELPSFVLGVLLTALVGCKHTFSLAQVASAVVLVPLMAGAQQAARRTHTHEPRATGYALHPTT